MIDLADIRIGNLVWYYDRNMEETAFQVEGIFEGYIYNSGLPLSKLPADKAHPLILDLYLLRRFGFIQGDPAYGESDAVYSLKYSRLNSIHILCANDAFQPVLNADGTLPYGRPIVHVHQLQNMYQALTRDELEIFE
ncbi:hypothetical protein MKQ68_06090 [Chitinophaga horti]|uniref:Uncharacterized protein n=1 Tax=Chitinophaga horti TaxID=2920382 RepID=A0ABY6J918_9BACT|nr:hypothetical protein [Chitinophaga horti]UYQ94659.1 hypothetical protein MKQ68_06090 [Chitinophaga horti]